MSAYKTMDDKLLLGGVLEINQSPCLRSSNQTDERKQGVELLLEAR
jgi:hypothetical protein